MKSYLSPKTSVRTFCKNALLTFSVLFISTLVKSQALPVPNVVPNIDWQKDFSSTTSPSLVSIANAIDANSRVYSTGYMYNGTNKDLVVLGYDSLGIQTFSPVIYDNGGDDIGNAIVFDAAGYLYIVGSSYGSIATQNDYVIMKVSPAGSVVWTKRYNATSGDDIGKDIRVDASGNVYCTGTAFTGIAGQNNIATVKFTSTGTQT